MSSTYKYIYTYSRANTTHPWEKNSPVFENTSYLKMIYENMMKREYLKQAAIYSKVTFAVIPTAAGDLCHTFFLAHKWVEKVIISGFKKIKFF